MLIIYKTATAEDFYYIYYFMTVKGFFLVTGYNYLVLTYLVNTYIAVII